MITLLLFFV